jgi:hypothetical protein
MPLRLSKESSSVVPAVARPRARLADLTRADEGLEQ